MRWPRHIVIKIQINVSKGASYYAHSPRSLCKCKPAALLMDHFHYGIYMYLCYSYIRLVVSRQLSYLMTTIISATISFSPIHTFILFHFCLIKFLLRFPIQVQTWIAFSFFEILTNFFFSFKSQTCV